VLGRRLLLLVVVLMGLTAVAASLAPRPPGTSTPGTSSTRTPAPTITPPDAAPVAGEVVEERLPAVPRGELPRLRLRVGDRLRLEVEGEVLDVVELRGLDRLEAIAPEAPARFELLAERPGRHAIVLTEADRRIGELQISAAR
jgi:hypothetical protein